LQPPDFHACFEAYLGQRWFLFDPTKLTPLDSLTRIGTGRDAADASFATIFGSAQMMEMSVFYHEEVQETESDGHTALSTC
jgi:transglutaminase-like putative cysteine protease